MKLKLVFICLISVVASSCMWNVPAKQAHAITKDTLVYIYKDFKERAADCGKKADSGCTVVKIKYPQFIDQRKLNDSITGKLISMFKDDKETDTSLSQLSKNFFKDYQNFKQNPKYLMFYDINGYAKILRQDSSILTLETGGYVFKGGAHPASSINFINWNTKSNKNILLDDILVKDYQTHLNEIAEGIFRHTEKLADTSSLAVNYFFKGNKFALNNNYSITPLGLRFLYNQYEIKPYAAGITSIFIPWAQIKFLLKPHTVVAQYIQ